MAFALSNLAAGTAQQLRATLRASVLRAIPPDGALRRGGVERNARNFREEPPPPFWPKTNWAAVALVDVLARGTRSRCSASCAGCDVLCA